MRLLHTSDWHLGQTFHELNRGFEQASFLAWLLEQLTAERPDALLICGDVFDSANPSSEAQRLFYSFLREAKLRVPHLTVVIIAGNHDSPGRLEAPLPLLGAHGAVIVGQVLKKGDGQPDLERLLVPLVGAAGDRAMCLAVPFLRPGDVPKVEGESDPFNAGVATLYHQCLELAQKRRSSSEPIIALGHCHLVGGEVSEVSERRIIVGNAQALPLSVFDDELAYVALGHLHRPQQVGGLAQVRYSGSPLPMSFTEVDYPHQVVLVDLPLGKPAEIRPIRVPRFVELLRVPALRPGSLEEVLAEIQALEVPPRAPEAQPYLQARVRLDGPEPGLRAKVEAALLGKPVRLVSIEVRGREPLPGEAGAAPPSLAEVTRLSPEDVFLRLYQKKWGDPPEDLLAAFRELLLAQDEECKP